MGRRFVIAGIAAIITLAACNDANAPTGSRVATIYQIRVPAHASFTDTVHVAFSYAIGPCDTGTVVEARPEPDGVRFTVRSFPTNRVCPLNPTASLVPLIVPQWTMAIGPPHASPLRLVFTEPSGGDSVRVISP